MPFGVLAGLHIDQDLFAILARLGVHGIPAKIEAASLDPDLALFLLCQPKADGTADVAGAGVGCAGAAATTGAGAGLATGAASCWVCGAGTSAGGCVVVEVSAGATLAVVVEGSGEGFTGARVK